MIMALAIGTNRYLGNWINVDQNFNLNHDQINFFDLYSWNLIKSSRGNWFKAVRFQLKIFLFLKNIRQLVKINRKWKKSIGFFNWFWLFQLISTFRIDYSHFDLLIGIISVIFDLLIDILNENVQCRSKNRLILIKKDSKS